MTPPAAETIAFTAAAGRPAAADAGFPDPEWRGEQRRPAGEPAPLASLEIHAGRLEDWIRGGACYGWLDSYQSRRAAFELQSIRTQLKGCRSGVGRNAVQSRLERLDRTLRCARGAAWSGRGEMT